MPLNEEEILKRTSEVLRGLKKAKKINAEDDTERIIQSFKKAVSDIVIESPTVNVAPTPPVIVPAPEVNVSPTPPVVVPAPKVEVKTPGNTALIKELKQMSKALSEQKTPFMPTKMDVNFTKPQPVIITDSKGKPFLSPMGGGGGANHANIRDAFGSSSVDGIFNPDNRVRVSVETGGGGLTDDELRAASVPVSQVSGATDSVNVVTTVGLTDTEIRATALPISGTVTADAGTNLNTSALATSANQLADGHNVTVDNASIAITDAITAGWDNAVSDGASVSGEVAHDSPDAGEPVKMGGKARTANPTAVANNDRVDAFYSDVGMQVMRPIQVRDLLLTAYVVLSNGTETDLLDGTSSQFHDLIYIMGANTSDAAVTVEVRSGTANSVQLALEIPANATQGVSLPVPIPQSEADQAWTVDMPDITNSTVNITGLFTNDI